MSTFSSLLLLFYASMSCLECRVTPVPVNWCLVLFLIYFSFRKQQRFVMFAFQCTFKTELLCVDMMTSLSFFSHVGPMPTKLRLWYCITMICSYCKSLLTGHTTYIFNQHPKVSIFYYIYIYKTVHTKSHSSMFLNQGSIFFSAHNGVKN